MALAALAALGASACAPNPSMSTDPPGTMRIEFRGVVGDRPFACGQRYTGVGTSRAEITPADFRLYVYDVQLVRGDGTRVPFELVDDGAFQGRGIALLDFEDGTGTCETGSPETRTHLLGRAPSGEYTGVAFKVGVPEALNHLDAPTAAAPLNIPGLWWSWSGGYKFARIEVRTSANPFFYFHLGATSCMGTLGSGFSCAYGNRGEVVLNGMNLSRDAVRVDLAALLAGVDVNRAPDGMTDRLAGCMSFAGDPECPAMFGALGLTFTDQPRVGTGQTLFSIGARTP
jgi:uncharacterized repeat protein (TIGR04052 family)